jgi:hypothetical protein
MLVSLGGKYGACSSEVVADDRVSRRSYQACRTAVCEDVK